MRLIRLPVKTESLAKYSKIPISFETVTQFQIKVVKNGLGGIVLSEKPLKSILKKDYDQLEEEGLTRWLKQFDTSKWTIFFALENDVIVGGAIVVLWTPGIRMFQGRQDIALVWDIRVLPEWRRSGIGTKLFSRAVIWSKKNGCRFLKVETQNTNPSACKFYVKQGCQLGEINRFVYTDPRVIEETMLVWYRDLSDSIS